MADLVRSRSSCRWLALGFGVLAIFVPAGRAVASAPPLPGPPPGAGTGLPLPPSAGQAPPSSANGPALTIDGRASGPGLLGPPTVNARDIRMTAACRSSGQALLTVGQTTVGAKYRCRSGRGQISLRPSAATLRAFVRSGSTPHALRLVQPGLTQHLSVSLVTSSAAPARWISAFGLSCSAGGPLTARLDAPNFSGMLPTTIDVRPWLAWYSSSTGWQWIGTRGLGTSSWYRWTATPTGVAEWRHGTTVTPWTWGPITVAGGHQIELVAVLEAIYWYGRPNDVWRYASSEPNTSGPAVCVYP